MRVWLFAPVKRVEDGYGNSTADIQEALEKQGIEVVRSGNEPHDIVLIYGPPDYHPHVVKYSDKPVVIYTMWETEEPPKDWGQYLLAAAAVANPSPWGVEVFKKAYGLKDVEYIPLGYHDSFKQIDRKRDGSEPFTFLVYNSGFGAIRKGFFEVVGAFKKAFKPTDNVRIIIKSARPEYYKPNEKIWKGMQENGLYKNMEYVPFAYPREGLRSLLEKADCFVFPSRGEGFGHTPLEAMATGLTAIIPNKHGMAQYFNPQLHYTYRTEMKESSFDREGNFGDWPVANIDSLAATMRYAYEHQGEVRAKGVHCPAWAAQWNYERTAKMLIEMFEKVTQNV